ncbi:hypothetical protein DIU31_025060 [Mucilaginibacter rubeus]|uniref:T9SS C-terminal target domain-containing protein n=1 Tax=Mucilaginibacter rubeus TaxID=2027860 RepID=A0AAE6MKC1_9SPHI|nr:MULTISPECIES: hypothetical protein [Mucilaginibacter]QEM06618.1 hypothetical protein DIU31_025060 [Mucilaginibacter rubeus]QEM19207.1 hypothetical protein DIU38_025325 [Mucilaginibacter gossypii]QTE44249.1 hypothetical protein J3L19_02390 [Mucilaginibacter rubeus]QTE50849.1 hypothetical protein J3L21_02365 [Mucilaginibacter rubeus]QTE55931.1 hypothetical protein J3L23_27600 [Mucilaginibacter rubeus]
MRKIKLIIIFVLLGSGFVHAQERLLHEVADLPDPLRENSSLVFTKAGLWTMNDGPATNLYRIDERTGKILQEVRLSGCQTMDTEALTADANYLYIGDFGNNHEPRTNFHILRIKLSEITKAAKQDIQAELISYTYEDFGVVDLNSSTDHFDCEAMLSLNDKIYLFTKRRGDHRTILYELSNTPGKQLAKKLQVFNSDGLITDAAINKSGTEIALIGYLKGHKNSFVWLLNNFKGNQFFSGKQQRIEIAKDVKSWQTEGIAYKSDNHLFISCEQTNDVNCRLYKVSRQQLITNK